MTPLVCTLSKDFWGFGRDKYSSRQHKREREREKKKKRKRRRIAGLPQMGV